MTDNAKKWEELALSLGFSEARTLPASQILCRDEIRALCAPEKCRNYGTSWICPPACGTIEQCRATVSSFQTALVLMSLHENVDWSNGALMRELALGHNSRAWELACRVRETGMRAYMLTTGGCELCQTCTFPDAPCRRPDKDRGSLSAFGIDVTRLCGDAGLEFSFTPGTLRLVACLLYS